MTMPGIPLRRLAGSLCRLMAPAIIAAILLAAILAAAGPPAQGAEVVSTPLRQYGWGRLWEKALSPDGTKVLLSCGDGRVRLVDAATGQVLQTLQEPGIYLASARFSPDGTKALTLYGSNRTNNSKSVTLWDLASGQRLWKCDHPASITSLAWSPNGSRVLAGSDRAYLIDASTGRILGSYPGLAALAFSSDGACFLGVSNGNKIYIYTLGSAGAPQVLTNSNTLDTAIFTPDGLGLVSSDFKATKVWDLVSGTVVRTMPDMDALAFTPDGTGLLFGGPLYQYSGPVYQYDPNNVHFGLLQDYGSATTRFRLPDELNGVVMPFSSDSSRLLNVNPDFKLQLWDTLTGEKKLETPTSGSQSYIALFTADGAQILTYGGGHVIDGGLYCNEFRLLDTATGHLLRTTTFTTTIGDSCSIQAFSPDRSRFMIHREYTVIHVGTCYEEQMRDTATGTLLWTVKGSYNNWYGNTAFTPGGSTVLIGYGSEARLLDAASGALIRKLTGHAYQVYAVAISPDGTQALTGSEDDTARLWNLATGATVQQFNHGSYVEDVAFAPDGMRILTISNGYGMYEDSMKLWNGATGALLWTVSGDYFHGVSFSPDGKKILTVLNGTVRFLDAATGQELYTFIDRFPGSYDDAASAVFSPDGRTILTSHESGAARLWKIPIPCAAGKWTGYE